MNVGEWLKWVVATVAAAFTMAAYAHGTFITVREQSYMIQRLDRIVLRLDKLLDANNHVKN